MKGGTMIKSLLFLAMVFTVSVSAETVELPHAKTTRNKWCDVWRSADRTQKFHYHQVLDQYGYAVWKFSPNHLAKYNDLLYPCNIDFLPKQVVIPLRNLKNAGRFYLKFTDGSGNVLASPREKFPAYMAEQGLFPFSVAQFKESGKSKFALPITGIWIVVEGLNDDSDYEIELSSILLEK